MVQEDYQEEKACDKRHNSNNNNNNNRHNKVAGYIHWTIRKQMWLQGTDRYKQHIAERVINVKGAATVWEIPSTSQST